MEIQKKLDPQDIEELLIELEEHKTGKSPLDKLPPEIQNGIICLMADHPTWVVEQFLTRPAPEGMGIKTSESALNRFRRRYKETLRRQSEKTRVNQIESVVLSNEGDLFKSSIHLLEGRLLKALSNAGTVPDDLQRLSRSLAALRRQALAEGHPIQPCLPPPSSRNPSEPTLDYEL